MASPEYLANYKFPLTEKPVTNPSDRATFEDIFNLQNTLRLLLPIIVEEAPVDGKEYARKDEKWVEVTGGGGGGGGIPEAPEDGKLYGRKDASWVEVPTAPSPSSRMYISGLAVVPEVNGTSISVRIPSGIGDGDLILLSVMHRTTIPAPSGYTLVNSTSITGSGTTQYESVFAKAAVAADRNALITITPSASSRLAINCVVVAGAKVKSSSTQVVTLAVSMSHLFLAAGTDTVALFAGSATVSQTSGPATLTFTPNNVIQLTPATIANSATESLRQIVGLLYMPAGVATHNVTSTAELATPWAGVFVVLEPL